MKEQKYEKVIRHEENPIRLLYYWIFSIGFLCIGWITSLFLSEFTLFLFIEMISITIMFYTWYLSEIKEIYYKRIK
jgi:hypothetical protein